MSTKSAYQYPKSYTMDQREFSLIEALVGKEIIMIPREGVDFYFSYECFDARVHTIAIEPNKFCDKIDHLHAKAKKFAASLGNQDYRLYGLYLGGECSFYDLKINENYFTWEDFCAELETFELPISSVVWKGIVESTQALKDKISKRTGKGDLDFIFRPINEEIEITYAGGERRKAIAATQVITIQSSETSTTNETQVNKLLEDLDEGGVYGPLEDARSSAKSEDNIEELETIENELEPWLTCTIVSEDGELDETSIQEFFDYYSKGKNMKPVFHLLQEDGIEINSPNKSLVVEQIVNFISSKIVDDAFFTTPSYIKESKESFIETIKKEITPNCNALADQLINEQKVKDYVDSYVEIDEYSIEADLKSLLADKAFMNGLAQATIHFDIWKTPDIQIFCEKELSEQIADDLYCLGPKELFGEETIKRIKELIHPKMEDLAKNIGLLRHLLIGY